MPQRIVQRRPTIPMRKEDRKRLSDIEKLVRAPKMADSPGSDGRAGYTLQRSDSYKRAISKENRISVLFGSESDFQKKDYDKEKYRTLPSQIGTIRLTSRTTSGHRRHSSSSHMIYRQESGIVPSPDTDEDQRSSGSTRKRKSRFQQAKERIFHSFQKQTITEEERRQKRKEKQEKQKKVKIRKKKMKSSSLEVIQEHYAESVPKSRLKRIFSFRKSHKVHDGEKDLKVSDTVNKKAFKNSEEKPKVRESVQGPTPSHSHDNDDGHMKPVDAVFKSLIFGEISNGSTVKSEKNAYSHTHGQRKAGDRNNLSLDLTQTRGRRVVRRYSSKKDEKVTTVNGWSHHTQYVRQVSVYSDIEIDGHGDEIDSPKTTDKHKKDDRPFEELPAEEREHRISEVADRLKFIGDKAVERYNTESSSSGVESPHGEAGGHSARGNDQIVEQLIAEFRREGDRLSQDYNLGSLTPVVLDIARQHTYTQFKKVIHSSLHSTIGWDQIALYFYLTRTAVHVAKGSVGLAQMAYDYFRETYSGWVEDRGGWETMLEETDCELD
ncbi:pre-mRNA-splicing factor CWC22 homolog isoform X2 [Saccostrea echinata]|nr:pre-mRNA-splicing factor CWC22 homolog isoform X2 [Saccostrea echinata]